MPHDQFASIQGLNEEQRAAVLKTEGPLLVLAGAGSGKTRVITHRILHLIEKGIPPECILAVTFTNKAAREMRERLTALVAEHGAASRATRDALPTLTTFHAFGVRVLREQYQHVGLRRSFTIYDRADSNRAIKQALEEAGYSPKQFEPRKILGIISRAKGNALSRLAFSDGARSYPEEVASEVWERYERTLRADNALDFDDLLLETWTLLANNTAVRDHYRTRYPYIHIDEYQDTNKVQYEIVRALAGEDAHVCAVGDVDQNIYSWRGADISNILQFERHFPGASVVLLEENYRSTKTIIAASNSIIEKNTERIPKTVFTKNADGEPLALYTAYDEGDEARFIAETSRALISDGASPADIAVLFRTNFQSRALEEAFLTLEVPYQVLGVRFFERKEVKDVLSFLRYAVNPESTADLARIVNVPPRGIGKVTLLKLIEGKRVEISGKAAAGVLAFEAILADIRACAKEKPLSETVRFIIKRTGLEELLKQGGEEELERLENLRELVSYAARYDELAGDEAALAMLESAALQSDQDELPDAEDGAVKLMTIHAAKGLEFPYVFVTGLEEGLFPHERLETDARKARTDEEEERRLFYVALTRAEKKVFLTHAHLRTIFGSTRTSAPSSFLADLDPEHLELLNPVEPSGFERTIYLD